MHSTPFPEPNMGKFLSLIFPTPTNTLNKNTRCSISSHFKLS